MKQYNPNLVIKLKEFNNLTSIGETMKSKINKLLCGATLMAAFIGCSDNDGGNGPTPGSSSSETSSSSVVASTWCEDKGVVLAALIDANITEDACLVATTEYEFSGIVYVEAGVTLTIEPGTTIKSSDKSALIVSKGAKIISEGTATNPIVFTSSNATPKSGDWGGIVVYGKAPVSNPDNTLAFEAIPEDIFGGDVEDDNSGIIKYTRVEYAGNTVAKDSEFNGITLGGVGSGTTLEYIQVEAGSDDGIEWFGGSANGKYLITSNGQDDGFDIDFGYQGTITNALNIGRAQASGLDASDKGIEAGSKANNAARITDATFENLTIITQGVNESGKAAGIHVKNNVALSLDNAVIVNVKDEAKSVIKVEGTRSFQAVKDGESTFKDVYYGGAFATNFDIEDAEVLAAVEGAFKPISGEIFNSDLSVKSADAAGKGAVTSDNVWYKGWTKEGSLNVEGIEVEVSTPSICDDKDIAPALIEANIDADVCLSNDTEYELSGIIYVEDGATIFVEPGTTVKSLDKSALIISQGAKIHAEGTQTQPIVFTSKAANPVPGDWGGIVIYGKAPVSNPGDTLAFEAIPTDYYGGSVADDNSGILKFVRVEYAGNTVAKDSEFNGITFGGVGSATTLEYVQVDRGSDDGMEWFGGEMNASNLITSNGQDDGFDIDFGFQGTITNSINIGIEGVGGEIGSDKGIEAGSKANNPARITDVTFDKLTIVLQGPNEKGGNGAIHIKNNVALKVNKAVIVATKEVPSLLKLEGTVSTQEFVDGNTAFTDVFYQGTYTTEVEADKTILSDLRSQLTEVSSAALNSDLTAKAQEIIDAEAGAVDTKWYNGWTKAGSLDLSL